MGDFYIYADFPAGFITERIVDNLSKLSIREIAALLESGKLVVPKGENPDEILQNLTHRNLRWYWIDDYAAACSMTLQEIIYGKEKPQKTYYSHFDDAVIPLLNIMPKETILAATEVLHAVYYNPRFRISLEDTPSAKIIAIAVTGWRMPQLVPEAELDRYQTNINEALSRLRANRFKERFIFHLNYILDMCTYCHVSPHWAFSLYGPLLCKTAEADILFDLFCLLSRQQQIAALAMLVSLCPAMRTELPSEICDRIYEVINKEGGVVSCL